MNDSDFSQDLLYGAAAIAQYLFGSEKHVRRVYYLRESGQLPTFMVSQRRFGARKSTLQRMTSHTGERTFPALPTTSDERGASNG